ncbi:isochorismatase family cysteine hydrolase [Nocardia alni]|uniref:isochorismatase family cysteine hydrolase n=1 Tax=Nocardia alni TaxID=2815723 RepID=UPI001C214223|nr:isochorismatase family cysteine hydrolase [Nocardia alni]
MPITTIDPRTALIVIDLQQGVAEMPLAHPFSVVTERTVELLRAFRERGLPVVLVNVAGSPSGRTDAGSSAPRSLPDDWSVLVPELDRQPEDILVTKYARSAFTATGLAERLRELDVTQVVITGVATAGGVESTARDAHEQGFNVTLPVDAMTDSQLARHEHSITTVFPRIAESGTTRDVLEKL